MANEMALDVTTGEIMPVDVNALPEELLAIAQQQAKALVGVVEANRWFEDIGGRRHLRAEAWETIGAFNKVFADIVYCTPVEVSGEVVAYEAKAVLYDIGTKRARGSGIMSCGMDEFPTRGKQGWSKNRAAMSAAQTWAVAKAYRVNFAWVVTMAGYSPTPADEMKSNPSPAPQPTNPVYWCEEHSIEWFKTSRMKTYAHKPTDGSGNWCYMPAQT